MPVPAYVTITSARDTLGDVDNENFFFNSMFTDSSGFYGLEVPEGYYDMRVASEGFLFEWMYNIEVTSDLTNDFTLTLIFDFAGNVQGIVSLPGPSFPIKDTIP
jgi:hypothetical protein